MPRRTDRQAAAAAAIQIPFRRGQYEYITFMWETSLSTSSVSAIAPRAATEATSLTKTAGGEYTASSVESHPSLAAGLVKLKDGNYGEPIVAAADRYTASGISTDLSGLKLGG